MRSDLVWMRSGQVWMRAGQVWTRSGRVCMRSGRVWMRSGRDWMRSGREWMISGRDWMKSGQVVGEIYPSVYCLEHLAINANCQRRNSSGFDHSILRHSGIWGAADEAVLNNVHKKKKSKNPPFKCCTINPSIIECLTNAGILLPVTWVMPGFNSIGGRA